ncbi:MAG: arsenate reductase ArsC [Tepidisphaerales bacterium]
MSADIHKPLVLFLCTGNSCRSQMAEGWARHLKGDQMDVYSAGIEPRPIDPRAIGVMAEAGVDISRQSSKDVRALRFLLFDCVVTVCDRANRNCPTYLTGRRHLHVGFDDPPELARGANTEEDALNHYRRVRDEIRAFIERAPEALLNDEPLPGR